MIVPCSRLLTGALAAACAMALACGGDTPAAPTPPVTAPPAATPAPGAGVSSCPLGMGSRETTCSRTRSQLLPQVEAAIDLTVQQKPALFDLTNDAMPGWGHYKVREPQAYLDAVIANLQAAGLCAQRDPDDGNYERIDVKESNDYSEDFDVVTSAGFIRRGDGAYRGTCTPASFPVERAADEPPIGSRCGQPFPPPVIRFHCKIHQEGGSRTILDSTPMVGPDCAYCASVGFSDGRCFCAIRKDGAADRVACENWRVGTSKDTGRPGPTWTKEDGSYCEGPDSGCANSLDTQYQLWVYERGRYKAKAENGASCTVDVER
jgi:hypothetical protein